MKYRAEAYIPHEEIDDVVRSLGETERIHSVIPVRHTETTDLVTIIVEEDETFPSKMPFVDAIGTDTTGCGDQHEFEYDPSIGTYRCADCGRGIDDVLQDNI